MTDELLASQRAYYNERADDYGDVSKPDRKVPGLLNAAQRRAIIDEFAPTGDVLEMACGNGWFTADLARHATTLTALDASERMIEINRTRVDDPKVRYINADIFTWEPDRTYDAIFFAAWLSHVPPAMFDEFWELARRCLAPGGRVAFEDEDDRATDHDDVRDVAGVPVARRTLADGRRFDVVKVFWNPTELASRLHSSGWEVSIKPVDDKTMFGIARSIR
jgi:SAM-dependent methyltransferase